MSKNIVIVLIVLLVGGGAAAYFLTQGYGDDKKSSNGSSNNSGSEEDSGSTSEPLSGNVEVSISNFSFSPSTITIKKGTTVTWTNDDSTGHTVTSDSGGELNSKLLSSGDTFKHTFNTVGSNGYHCTPHPSMKGTVVVVE